MESREKVICRENGVIFETITLFISGMYGKAEITALEGVFINYQLDIINKENEEDKKDTKNENRKRSYSKK